MFTNKEKSNPKIVRSSEAHYRQDGLQSENEDCLTLQ